MKPAVKTAGVAALLMAVVAHGGDSPARELAQGGAPPIQIPYLIPNGSLPDRIQGRTPTDSEQKQHDQLIQEPEKSVKPVVRSKIKPSKTFLPSANLHREKQHLLYGNPDQTNRRFERLLEGVRKREDKARIRVDWANTLKRAAQLRNDDKNLTEQAIRNYRTALPALKGPIRLVAHNNFGALLLRDGKNKEALSVLSAVEKDYTRTKDRAAHARYLYNLARGFETNGQPGAAKARYRQAATTDFNFTPAFRAVFRMISKRALGPQRVTETAAWIDVAVTRGQIGLAEKTIKVLFERPEWKKRPDFNRVLISLMQVLTATRAGIADFERTWAPQLIRIGDSDEAATPTAGVAKEITAAYFQDFKINFRPGSGSRLFRSALSSRDKNPRRTVSAFLKMVGDSYMVFKKPDRALQRYALAWTMDTTNVDAALFAANVLLEKSERIDRSVQHLNRFVRYLFEGKGQAYLGNDWENILRFHTILGTIYEKKKEWGNSSNPRSAVFQFENAIRAYNRLLELSPRRAGAVALRYAQLATAYEGAGRNKDALDKYLDSTESALGEARRELAKTSLANAARMARRINLNQYPKERQRLERLTDRLRKLR